ncbi:MAG: hypothetical protein M3524_09985, partial [Actinomycetota bacterium]|nr:hypothetical protein [Actinomycetota bacterium]
MVISGWLRLDWLRLDCLVPEAAPLNSKGTCRCGKLRNIVLVTRSPSMRPRQRGQPCRWAAMVARSSWP